MLTLAQNEKKVIPQWASIVLGTLLFLICANFKLFLPISLVPISMHVFAVLVLGSLLPLRQSLACFVLYMALSPLFGMPLVFATCLGYYAGFAVALCFLNQFKNKMPLLARLVLVSAIILGLGFCHLQPLLGASNALKVGVFPFIPGDALKICMAYLLLRRFKKSSFEFA